MKEKTKNRTLIPGWHLPRKQGWPHHLGRSFRHSNSQNSHFICIVKKKVKANDLCEAILAKGSGRETRTLSPWHGLLQWWLVQFKRRPQGRPQQDGTAIWQAQSAVSCPPRQVTGTGTFKWNQIKSLSGQMLRPLHIPCKEGTEVVSLPSLELEPVPTGRLSPLSIKLEGQKKKLWEGNEKRWKKEAHLSERPLGREPKSGKAHCKHDRTALRL